MTVLFDLETDGLIREVTQIHCGVCYILEEDRYLTYTSRPIKGSDGTIEDMLELLSNADILVAHNGVKYDIPVIKKLYWWWSYKGKLLDTLLMSKLAYPNIALTDANRKTMPPKLKGGHSIASWGYRLRKLKGDYGKQDNAWDILTEDMITYCLRDVEILVKIYQQLLTKNIPEQALWLEHEFAKIIARQEQHGVYFNIKDAQALHIELLEESETITKEMKETFGYIVKQGEVVTPKNNRTEVKGKPCPVRYYKDVPYCRVEFEEFNPGSRDQIFKVLSDKYGWKPTEYTEKGSVIVNEGILEGLEYPEAKLLNRYLTLRKLLGQLAEGDNAWLKCVDYNTSRIYGSVDTLGAVSRRCTHSRPNMAQVPSPRAFKGKECRQLFTVPKGKKIVGCDMSGLELRVFAHYLARYDKGKYASVILNEDIHTYNQKAAGLPTRDNAKTFIYGTLYGAGDAKVGLIVGKDAVEGKRLKDMFKRNVPAYKNLVEDVDKVYKKVKTLKALDGNPYFIRSAHSALNTLLQGAGALLCKVWLIIANEELSKKYTQGKQFEFVLNVHDEFSTECDEDIAEDVAKIVQECTRKAGEYFNLRIQLDGEAKIGNNWYDVH